MRNLAIAGLLALPLACGPTDYQLDPDTDTLIGDDPENFDGGGVEGRICAPSENAWIAGALVYVDHEFGRAQTTTDSDGFFTLTGVPEGTHTVHVEKGSFSTDFEVTIAVGEIITLDEEECIRDEEVNIAVVTGLFDSIEDVLDRLGIEYTTIDGLGGQSNTFMSDPTQLEQYDIIFFNCGMDESWIWSSQTTVAQNLRDFVSNGGSIYASDWAYFTVEASHPNMLDFHGDDYDSEAAKVGNEGFVTGTVKDPTIASALGSGTASLNYDLGIWVAVTSASDQDYVLLEGTYGYSDFFGGSGSHFGPLAAKMQSGSGTVLYTTFHNEAQTTADMDVILQEIIFHL